MISFTAHFSYLGETELKTTLYQPTKRRTMTRKRDFETYESVFDIRAAFEILVDTLTVAIDGCREKGTCLKNDLSHYLEGSRHLHTPGETHTLMNTRRPVSSCSCAKSSAVLES